MANIILYEEKIYKCVPDTKTTAHIYNTVPDHQPRYSAVVVGDMKNISFGRFRKSFSPTPFYFVRTHTYGPVLYSGNFYAAKTFAPDEWGHV